MVDVRLPTMSGASRIRSMFGLRLRIRYQHQAIPRGVLVLVLLPTLLLVILTASYVRASTPAFPAAPSATTLGVRQFYLTYSTYQAGDARTVCASGYHFASIWEIADPSALKYNTDLGRTGTDSGGGPPTQIWIFGGSFVARGWVRTGYSTSSVDTVGRANCSGWGTSDQLAWGTAANLPSDWTAGEQDIGVWNTEVRTCNTSLRVWCVQDDSVWRVFLSMVLRND
jgi:hypothetical protein